MIWTSEMEPVVIDDTTVGAAIGRGRPVTRQPAGPHRRPQRQGGQLCASSPGASNASPHGSTPTASRPGDCVAIWAPNLPPVAACTLAAMGLGAPVTCLNPAWSDDEVDAQLGDADATVLVTAPDLADRARSFGIRRVVVLGEAAPGAVPACRIAGQSG